MERQTALDPVSSNAEPVTDINTADAEIQRICDEIKAAAESKAGKSYGKFEAKQYTSYPAARCGTNFFIKDRKKLLELCVIENQRLHVNQVQVAGEDTGRDFIHVKVFRSFVPGSKLELSKMEANKSESDPISYF